MPTRLEALQAQLDELLAVRGAEHSEFLALADQDVDLTDAQEARWKDLTGRFDRSGRWVQDDEADVLNDQIVRLSAIRSTPATAVESAVKPGLTFARKNTDDPYEVRAGSASNGEARDAAARALDVERGMTDDHKTIVENLVARLDGRSASISRRILATGSPAYRSAFQKFVMGEQAFLTDQERNAVVETRAGSLTDAAGGYAVPFTLDPTLIDTGVHNGATHEWRQLATVTPVTGDNWQGVSSAGVTASMVGEAEEATDNFPTIAQPAIGVKKAQAFLPFSIEIDMDWPALESEMRGALMTAKGELEDVQFTTGSGSGNNVNGLVTDLVAASSPIVASTTSNAIAAVEVYSMENALGQRFRRNAKWLSTRTVYNVIRALDTAGSGAMWERIGAGLPPQLLGYDVHEAPNMDSTYGSGENYVMILGDIAQAYRIIDRVGMVVDLVPHLFGTNSNYPTGQRGLYCYWRFGAKTVNTTAAKILNVT